MSVFWQRLNDYVCNDLARQENGRGTNSFSFTICFAVIENYIFI